MGRPPATGVAAQWVLPMIEYDVGGSVAWKRSHLRALVRVQERTALDEGAPCLIYADNLNLDDADDRRRFAREVVRFSQNGATADAVERELIQLYGEWE